jgi:hypothetical protein
VIATGADRSSRRYSEIPSGIFNPPRITYGEPSGPHTVSAVSVTSVRIVGPGALTVCTTGTGFTAAGGATGSPADAGDSGEATAMTN